MSNFCKIGFTSVFLIKKNGPEIAILVPERAIIAVMGGGGGLNVSLNHNVLPTVEI